jgi:hypothetical protein
VHWQALQILLKGNAVVQARMLVKIEIFQKRHTPFFQHFYRRHVFIHHASNNGQKAERIQILTAGKPHRLQ